jgi:hypothetical protein
MPSSVAAIQRITGWRTQLWIFDHLPGRALVPLPVQVFSREPQLDDEITGQVLRLGLAPFFSPEAEQSGLIAAHDDPDVRASNEVAAINGMPSFRGRDTQGHTYRCLAVLPRTTFAATVGFDAVALIENDGNREPGPIGHGADQMGATVVVAHVTDRSRRRLS